MQMYIRVFNNFPYWKMFTKARTLSGSFGRKKPHLGTEFGILVAFYAIFANVRSLLELIPIWIIFENFINWF